MRGEIKDHFHYVLVITNSGPVFVTGEGEGKTAYWKKDEKPKQFSDTWAAHMTLGLLVNGYLAYHVDSPIEIEDQPYFYDEGHFEWKEDKEETA